MRILQLSCRQLIEYPNFKVGHIKKSNETNKKTKNKQKNQNQHSRSRSQLSYRLWETEVTHTVTTVETVNVYAIISVNKILIHINIEPHDKLQVMSYY